MAHKLKNLKIKKNLFSTQPPSKKPAILFGRLFCIHVS